MQPTTRPLSSLGDEAPGSADVVDSVLSASRALVAVAARSLATVADDVTLPQYRALVELAVRGPQRPADLAARLGVDRSTTTRMCDRLVRKRLISRRHSSADRRSVRIALSADGVALVEEVTGRRRAEIERIVARIEEEDRPRVVDALRAFTEAAGGVPEHDWALGWRTA